VVQVTGERISAGPAPTADTGSAWVAAGEGLAPHFSSRVAQFPTTLAQATANHCRRDKAFFM
jgi:hypothetical protein